MVIGAIRVIMVIRVNRVISILIHQSHIKQVSSILTPQSHISQVD